MNIHTLYKPEDNIGFMYHARHSEPYQLEREITSVNVKAYSDGEIRIEYGVMTDQGIYYVREEDVLFSTTGPRLPSEVRSTGNTSTKLHTKEVAPNTGMAEMLIAQVEYQSKPRKKFCPNNACTYNIFGWCDGGDKYYNCGRRADWYIGTDRKKEDDGESGAPAMLHVSDLDPKPVKTYTPSDQLICYNLKCQWHTLGDGDFCLNARAKAWDNCTGRVKEPRILKLGINVTTATIGLDTPEVHPPMFH